MEIIISHENIEVAVELGDSKLFGQSKIVHYFQVICYIIVDF